MHLLHIISTLDPAKGGPAEGIRLLLCRQNSDWTGEVVTLDAPDAQFLREQPFQVHALGPAMGKFGYSRALLPWLRKNRGRFDGFILNGLWEYCGLATMLAAGRAVPYLVYTHGMLDPYFRRRFPLKHLKKAAYWYPVEQWVLRRAFRAVFTTKMEERLARRSFAAGSWIPAVVPYGIEGPIGTPERNTEMLFRRLPQLRGRRFLLFLGRLHPKKGCDLLVEAFCSLAGIDPELHLLMAGPDSEQWAGRLRATAEQAGMSHRLHWPGILQGEEKWGAFQAAEAFVLPSHQENFGIAVAEALSCGLPVLLSDQVNIGTIFERSGCAIVEPDTAEGTRHMLRRWFALSPEDRESMSDCAMRCYRAHFDLTKTVGSLRRIFQQAGHSGLYGETGSRKGAGR